MIFEYFTRTSHIRFLSSKSIFRRLDTWFTTSSRYLGKFSLRLSHLSVSRLTPHFLLIGLVYFEAIRVTRAQFPISVSLRTDRPVYDLDLFDKPGVL